MPNLLQKWMDSGTLLRVRRNHALEHATIHVLSARFPRTPIAGRADGRGFYLFGSLPSEAIVEAATEALTRMRAGEHHLAVHPNCGTNLLTAGALAGTASFFSLQGSRNERWRERMERLPLAIVSTVFALIVAQPLGVALQKYVTTKGDLGSLEILKVKRLQRGRAVIHRVLTGD